jgi:hypothetical protein
MKLKKSVSVFSFFKHGHPVVDRFLLVGTKLYDREKAWPSINQSILSVFHPSAQSNLRGGREVLTND